MKRFTVLNWTWLLVITLFVACNQPGAKKQFEVSGTITNSTAKRVYLGNGSRFVYPFPGWLL